MFFDVHSLPDDPEELDRFIRQYEEGITGIKADARATIVWADEETKAKTDYALIYLHGFKASYGEGEPVHRTIAKKFGFNLYLSRLYKHGIDDPDAFKTIKAAHFSESAKQALHIGKKLGKKVILMGTSTGGSLGLYLAGLSAYKDAIAALILYSPLVEFYGWRNFFLTTTPGRMLLRWVPGKNHMLTVPSSSTEEQNIWYSSFRLQGVLALGKFIQYTMHEGTFSNVHCPVFAGYYYRDESHHDKVISVNAVRKMVAQLGTEENKKVLKNYPDAQTHVIASQLFSGSIADIEQNTRRFLQNVLGLNSL